MNLNNKYLAIGLSIVAVVVVTYQIFLRKPEPRRPKTQVSPGIAKTSPKRSAPQTQPPGPPVVTPPPVTSSPSVDPALDPAADPAANMNTGTQPTAQQSGMMIDFNSPVLLNRVPPEMAIDFPKQELPELIGVPIFSRGLSPEDTPTQTETPKEITFKLNAIIIDSQKRVAIINDTILKVGDMILGAKVMIIVKSKAVLKINSKDVVLSTNSRIKKVKLIGGQGEK
jgi:hypothetical protein